MEKLNKAKKKEVYVNQIEKMKADYEKNVEMKKMLDEGQKLKQVADAFGVSLGKPNHLKKNYDKVQENLLDKINSYEWIVQLFKEGYTEPQIADLENLTKQNISRILKAAGVTREEGGRTKRRRDLIERIKVLAEEGFTVEDIAERLGENEAKVRQYVYIEKIDVSTKSSEILKDKVSKIVELRKKGLGQAEIGRQVGMSQAGVSNVLLGENMRTVGDKETLVKRDEQVSNDFDKGMSIEDISEKYGLKEMNTRRIIYKHTKNQSKEQ